MARKQFSIHYPDGSKKHVGRTERDEMLLGQLITPTEVNTYKYIGQRRSCHSLSELGELVRYVTGHKRQEPDYYPGMFIWELKQRRRLERMESSEALALRIPALNEVSSLR